MQPQMPDPLAELRPNILPEPVGLWPPAPGWWIVALLILAAIITGGLWLFRFWRKNRYRKKALKEAEMLFNAYLQHQDERRFAHDCNRLLKKVALHAYPKQDTASLSGKSWLEFLATTGSNNTFLEEAGDALGDQRFNPDWTPDVSALKSLTLSWIKKHYV